MQQTNSKPTAAEACNFLARYCDCLFGCGATCIRLEKNMRRMAAAMGMQAELSIFPHHIHLTLHGADCDSVTTVITIHHRPVSFGLNTLLSKLSWDFADGKIDFDQAVKKFDSLIEMPQGVGKWTELLLVSAANASFCRLFGGDFMAMLIVFCATAAGYATKQLMLEKGADLRLTVVICSFISAVLASADSLFNLGTTPELSVGTSVLYLVPGIPFINSFSDMLDHHYICAFGRAMNATVITCCLSAGLCAGMILMKLGMF